jgi:membrane-associated protease RseP (regulator of RpoE activity)
MTHEPTHEPTTATAHPAPTATSPTAGSFARRALLAGACALAAACATTAQAAPPDAKPAPPARAKPVVVHLDGPGPHPQIFKLGPDGAKLFKAIRGFLGLNLTDLTPELREHFGAPKDTGVLVARVAADSPAAKAGVKVGDILTTIDGEKVEQAWDASRRVRDKPDKSTATLEVIRNRTRQTLKAQIERKEISELDVGDFIWKDADWKGAAFHIDSNHINDAVNNAMKSLDKPDVRALLDRRRETEDRLQQRTRALEERIEKLEKQLQQKK